MSNGKNNDESPNEGEGEREEGRSRSRRSTRYLGELSALEPERLKHARVPTSSPHLVDIGISKVEPQTMHRETIYTCCRV